ncbi:TIGR03620 family F420-dependent LLM class oxidoreductase [Minwuia thermotolerans]|uniref:LLM class F420-dependent oxidoreductase n=1 Tax=Minwuia thermotolerans TaxID=2056226 RepID=A0A2M9G3H2_9PROT|nr:TIGR03620 family F420-dependent LLM class oxidoreductase [Minwuia thermotolerans]PJK30226.1 LLM class F420-dependent oxidoreductase [Minwuia thermotolerans]
MEKIGRLGVWYATHKFDAAQLRGFARQVEALGYAALWYPESVGYESMAQGAFLLGQTERLLVGSSIASIYARDAFAARQGHMTLNAISGGRFMLGLGVSHAPMVERLRGHSYGKPLAAMREYLTALRGKDGPGLDDPSRTTFVAALGPRMLDLAREMTAGAIPYNVTPEHTRRAREALGPEKWLCVEQKICLETDKARARHLARKELERYMPLPNYRNNWLRLGFTEDELADGGNDHFLDAMVANGDEAAIRAVVDAHFEAGADHVCIQPVHAPDDVKAPGRMLAAFAPFE